MYRWALVMMTLALPGLAFAAPETDPAERAKLVEEGKLLHVNTGCAACHDAESAQRRVGPPYVGLFGSTRALVDGREVKVDEAYLRRAILEPNTEVVASYPPAMPSYRGQLKPRQIDALIAYMIEVSGPPPTTDKAPAGQAPASQATPTSQPAPKR